MAERLSGMGAVSFGETTSEDEPGRPAADRSVNGQAERCVILSIRGVAVTRTQDKKLIDAIALVEVRRPGPSATLTRKLAAKLDLLADDEIDQMQKKFFFAFGQRPSACV